MVSMLPVRVKPIDRETEPATVMENLADWVIGRKKVLMVASIVLTLFLGSFIPSIEFNNQFVNFLKERLEIRRDTDYAAENLTGIFQVTWSLGTPEGQTVTSPEYLNTLDAFSQWLLDQDGVTHVSTLSNTVKGLNKLMARDDPNEYRIPDSEQNVARLMKLYADSLPEGLSLRSVITADQRKSRLIATTDNMRSKELTELSARSEQWLRDHAPARNVQRRDGAVEPLRGHIGHYETQHGGEHALGVVPGVVAAHCGAAQPEVRCDQPDSEFIAVGLRLRSLGIARLGC